MIGTGVGTAAGVLVASLVGSVHCAGMCGGFVCFYTGAGAPTADVPTADAATAGAPTAHRGGWQSPMQAHALYNVGRLLAYLTLGAIAGMIGARVSEIGALAGVQQAAAIVAGALMVAWALSTLAAERGISLGTMRVPMRVPMVWQRALGRLLMTVRSQPIAIRALITGLVTTMLPCGWLYVFVATAGGTGSVLSAMSFMAIFWLGTVPALIAVGVGAQTVLAPFRRRLPLISAAVVLVMGLWSMTGHLRTPSQPSHGAHVTDKNNSRGAATVVAFPVIPSHVH
jgi:sulfite exporter TauE/SafE